MNKLLSPRKAAKRLGLSREAIVTALVRGVLPANRDERGRWRIDPRVLDSWATTGWLR